MPLVTIILGRDILLSITAFYYRYVSLPPPRTLSRYWDFSLPSAEVRPTSISKVNTFLQLALIAGTLVGLALGDVSGQEVEDEKSEAGVKNVGGAKEAGDGHISEEKKGMAQLGFGETALKILEVSWWIVSATTLWSGLSYVGGRKGLRILGEKSRSKGTPK